ncbi:MAG: DUF937 domain-containing protein [Woeseiaceae bacterium]|nr:DUF937 domain-containing protein [Woeseiaceae bacterium]
MDLFDLLKKSGADGSVGELAGSLGLGQSQAKDLIGALSPALVESIKGQVAKPGGLDALQGALKTGGHRKYIDQPDLLRSEATRSDGNKILGHLFGSKDVSRNVAAKAAQDTGIDASLIKKALPLVAGLAMGAIGKNTAESKGDGLSGLLGGLIGSSGNGSDVGDLIGLAKKLF